MTKGQLAMIAAAGQFLAAKNSGRGPIRGSQDDGKAKAARAAGVSPARLTQALTVKEHAPDLVQHVIDATITLDAAYEQARERKRAAEWRDDGLRKLREVAPEIAEHVSDAEIRLRAIRRIGGPRGRPRRHARSAIEPPIQLALLQQRLESRTKAASGPAALLRPAGEDVFPAMADQPARQRGAEQRRQPDRAGRCVKGEPCDR